MELVIVANSPEIAPFPVPAGDKIFLTGSDRISEVHVYDLSGAQHLLSGVEHSEPDLSGLASGIYLLKVREREWREHVFRIQVLKYPSDHQGW